MSQESAAPDRARTFYSRLFYWPGLRPPDPLISPANSDDARRRLFAPQKTSLQIHRQASFRAAFFRQGDTARQQARWIAWLLSHDLDLLQARLRGAGFWKLSGGEDRHGKLSDGEDRRWLWNPARNQVVIISAKLPLMRGFHGLQGPVPRGDFLPAQAQDLLAARWVPALRVSNLAGTIKRAERLGAGLIRQQQDRALLKDPTGALFALKVQ